MTKKELEKVFDAARAVAEAYKHRFTTHFGLMGPIDPEMERLAEAVAEAMRK
jgi:hypothetical protein